MSYELLISCVVHHNVIWHINTGLFSSGFGFNAPNNDELVFNNTLYGNLNDISTVDACGEMENPWAGSNFFNNIFEKSFPMNSGAQVHNNYEGSEPGFENAKELDFGLKENSPCIDAGVQFSPYTDGFTGKAPDINVVNLAST
ncbi:MAG: hypothetical protein H7X94_01615 [Vallitaleaceae bacterium]|nr:hypothetical protein [Vallitaleaceae bacterium]